jgi:hypothetical protein
MDIIACGTAGPRLRNTAISERSHDHGQGLSRAVCNRLQAATRSFDFVIFTPPSNTTSG